MTLDMQKRPSATDKEPAGRPLAARPVTLLTYDTGQSTRARAAGLPVIKPARPIGDELR